MSRIKPEDLCDRAAETLAVAFDFFQIDTHWNRGMNHILGEMRRSSHHLWWRWTPTRFGYCDIHTCADLVTCRDGSERRPASVRFWFKDSAAVTVKREAERSLDHLPAPARCLKYTPFRDADAVATVEDAEACAWWIAAYVAGKTIPDLVARPPFTTEMFRGRGGVYRSAAHDRRERELRKIAAQIGHRVGWLGANECYEDGWAVRVAG